MTAPKRRRDPLAHRMACHIAEAICMAAFWIVRPTEERIRSWAVVRYL